MELARIELDKKKAFDYFFKIIGRSNTLSNSIFEQLNLKKEGQFFTLLPKDVNIQKVTRFDIGGVTRSLQDEITEFLLNKLKSNKKNVLIFDDSLDKYQDVINFSLFKTNGYSYNQEVYYILKSVNSTSFELIQEALRASDVVWHCLGILTTLDLQKIQNNILTNELINEICTEARLIITTAYDGEGYVFWEKTNGNG